MRTRNQARYHFGVDGQVLTERPWASSVNHYVEQILMHLRPQDWEARFTCYTRRSPYPLAPILSKAPVDWNEPMGSNFTWRHIALPLAGRRSRVDAMWFPFHTIPLLIGTPSAVTIHDISFVRLPHRFNWQTKLYLGVLLRRALAQASQILTISQFTADELIRVFNVSANRITIIYHGFSEHLTRPNPSVADALLEKLGLLRPYFLFLDGANSRKNIGLLIELLRKAPKHRLSDLQFIITGNSSKMLRMLKANGLGGQIGTQILLPGILPEQELDILYRRARALLYLSEYEGFGLPILEAFARQCPVIALRASSLPEVAGQGALFIEPDNTSQLEDALQSVMSEDTRRQLIALGEKEGHRFSWQCGADRLCQTLVNVAHEKK